MKLNRTENAVKNIVSGTTLKLYQMVIPFIIRTVVIYTIGMQYLGLSSLFTSVLQVLNLAELGVGNAMVYSMYEPIARDDTEKICALMKLYKIYYRIIGTLICVIGVALTPFIPKLISGEVPADINVYVLYLLNLFATVLSYWLFAYKNCLLTAHQRTDVVSKVHIVTFTLQYALQIAALLIFKNYYLYVIAVLLTQVITNVVTAIVATKLYPNLNAQGRLPDNEKKKINQHVKDLFTAKLGGVVTNSADTVVISAFLGLTVLAKYNNYYYIMSSIFGMMTILYNSCLAGIGNSLVVETPQKNFMDFKKFTFIFSWIIGFCTVCLYCLYQPFMRIWVHQENMLDDSFIVLFCIYFYVYELALVWATYKDAGGIWHSDRFRPLCVTIVNLTLNLIMVQFIGLYGILLSTVISYLVVGMPWLLQNVFSNLFRTSMGSYLKRLVYYVAVCCVGAFVCNFACKFLPLDGVLNFLLRIVLVIILSNVIFLLAFMKLPEFNESKRMASNMLKKIKRKI